MIDALTNRLSAPRLATLLGRSVWVQIANGLALVALAAYGVFFVVAGAHAGDAHAYWAADLWNPYTTSVNEEDAYLYAHAFLLVLQPMRLLPWEAFWVAWTILNLAALAWVVGPILAAVVLLPGAYSPVWVNLWYGNIGILMAAALVLVFRWPGAWSFLALTKVTPGVGIAWFLARRQWRYVLQAGIFTLAFVSVSFALTPDAWFAWPQHLAENSVREDVFFQLPPLWIRLVAAVVIAGIGGWLGARWTVPVAALLAQPVFWFTGFAMLVAWLGLVRHRKWLTADGLDRVRSSQTGSSDRDA